MNEKAKITFKHICREDTYMFNYTQLPDELFIIDFFKILSLHAKVLYSFMLRRVSLSKQNNWIDEADDVYIYYRNDEIMEKFDCSNKTASKIMSELEKIGLIEKKRQGQGKPDIIYVNKFSAVLEEKYDEENNTGEEPELLKSERMEFSEENTKNPEMNNVHFQKCKKYISGSEKSTLPEVKKVHANYKENSNKEKVISSSDCDTVITAQERVRLMEEEEAYYKEKILYQNTERQYSGLIAAAVFGELIKRNKDYKEKFTAEMFERICKAVYSSKEPIISMPGFVNWCMDHIKDIKEPPQAQQPPGLRKGGAYHSCSQFNQFMQNDYDFEQLEKEIVSN